MRRWFRPILARSIFLATVLAGASATFAQGVTGSAMTGVVRDPDAQPVPEAQVQLRNPTTGDAYNATTGADGTYSFDNVRPGGPYTITIVAPGYEPKSIEGFRLSLGQRFTLDIPIKYFGEEMVMISRADQLDDRNRTGASSRVKEQTINGLPLQGRNFTDLVTTTPLVTSNGGGISFAGQNNRFNNIQIDGGANNDLFGLAASGTPGGQSNAKPISLEAVQEFQVQVAPFDVRQGMFAGGLVNAITKRGTNEFHGALFGYYQSKGLANGQYLNLSKNVYEQDPNFTGFYTTQFGGSVGGPIVKDKVHFFVSADIQARKSAFGNPFNITGDDASDKLAASFTQVMGQRVIDILATKYGVNNAGDLFAPKLANPDRNVFAKITANVIEDSQLEVSYNYVNATNDILSRSNLTTPAVPVPPGTGNLRDGYQLSQSGYQQANTTNTGRLKLTSSFAGGRVSNELLTGFSIIRDARQIPSNTPLILVDMFDPALPNAPGNGRRGASDVWIAAGGERFSQANSLDQNIYQLQDNVTYAMGNHRFTAGTSNEFFHFKNVFLQAATGVWAFSSTATTSGTTNLDNANPAAYQRNLTLSPLQEPGTATFNVSQFGFYLQDEWSLPQHLSIQPGVRIDIPFLSKANQNPVLVNNTAFPIDTSKVPSGNILWSPRIGVNWDVDGTNDTIVRGGAGIFSGRPPYVWVSNAYLQNGLSQTTLTCVGPTKVPVFTADPNNQPTTCKDGTGPATGTSQGEIDYFDPNTKYPQNFRAAFGVDRRLPFGILGSVDVLYTRDVNGWYTTDANLQNLGPNGEGRTLYGNPNLITGVPATSRIDPTNLGPAVLVYNKNGGNVFTTSVQLTKAVGELYTVSVGYAYSRSRDRMSFTSSQAFSNFQFAPLDGELENRALRPSAFDRPHKVTINGTAALPFGFGLGLNYTGQSGTPYTFIMGTDANGDGVRNDLPFIPADPSQISMPSAANYAQYASFIDSVQCLRDAKGGLLQRGACRNPWQHFLDLRLTWTSPAVQGTSRFEVQWDIFNVLNLINQEWGHYDLVTGNEAPGPTFLSIAGYDAVNRRPIYRYTDPGQLVTPSYSATQSRWRMQLGARYMF